MNSKIISFDLIRGLAALLVMMGHLRSIIFISFEKLEYPNIFDRAFYFISGYGNQCVTVFFVLSGFFVGGSFLKSVSVKRHGLTSYFTNRITRLWVVLIPALVLTLLSDTIGKHIHPEIYQADSFTFIHPSHDLSITSLLGNLFFLQTIITPTYGSNSPLWSLANEFWYYLWFPLMWMALFLRDSTGIRILSICFLLVTFTVVFKMNTSIAEGLLLWLMGVASYLISTKIKLHGWVAGFFILVFLILFTLARLNYTGAMPYLLGLSTIGLLLSVIDLQPGKRLSVIAQFLSEISYTLYLVHLPFVFLLKTLLFPQQNLDNTFKNYIYFSLLCVLIVGFSYVVYFIFERNTGKVRKRIQKVLDIT